jgi:hypothetical protein
VKLTPLSGQAEDLDELILILRKTTAQPVTLIDPRAHLDAQLMKALAATHFFDIASAQNIGITLMVFPFDDLDVMTNLDAVCQFCGRQVDYVIVRNPARAPKTGCSTTARWKRNCSTAAQSPSPCRCCRNL